MIFCLLVCKMCGKGTFSQIWSHINFAEIEGFQVLIIIYVHSKWTEVIPLRQTMTSATLQALQIYFSNFGLPEEIMGHSSRPQQLQTIVTTRELNILVLLPITWHPMVQLRGLYR